MHHDEVLSSLMSRPKKKDALKFGVSAAKGRLHPSIFQCSAEVNSACAEVLPAAKRSYGALAPPARRPVVWFSYTFSRFQNIDFNRPFPVGAKFALLRGLFISGAKKTSSARFLTPSFQLGPTLLGPQLVCCPTGGVLRSRHTTHWERGRQTNAKEGRS